MVPPPEEEEEDEFGDFPTFKDSISMPKMIKRAEWGALPAKPLEPLNLPVRHVRFTYTGTSQCADYEQCVATVQKIQRDDMERDGLPDIRYNFLVGGEKAYFFEGRGWTNDASRPEKLDVVKGDCIDIAFIGNFKVDFPPFLLQVNTVNFVKMGQVLGYVIKDKEPVCHTFRDGFLNRIFPCPPPMHTGYEECVPRAIESPAFKLVDYGIFKKYIRSFPDTRFISLRTTRNPEEPLFAM